MNDKTGFKHTPLGWIPEEWEVKHFEEISDIDKTSLNGTVLEDYQFNYISLSDVDSDNFEITTTKQIYRSAPSRARRIVSKGDVLMATVRPNLQGFTYIRDDVKDLIASTGFAVITPKSNDGEFIFQYLFSNSISKQFYELLVGSNYPAINSSDVKKLKIIYPSFTERKRIAAILSTWDEAIAKTQRLIAQLQQRNKGLMQQLLKPKGDWKEYRIGNLLKEVKRSVKWNEEELYHLISVRRRSGGAFFRESLYGKQILTKQLFTAEAGDFLFSKMQIVHGASAIVPKDLGGMKISGSYIAVQAKDEKTLDINFFNWLSKTRWFYRLTYVSSYGVHIEKMTFDFNDFKRRKIMLPPTAEEQKRIVKILETANGEVHLYEKKLGILQQQKKGLMQKLLTGEIRVKIDD